MNKGKVISFLNMKGGVGKTTLCKEIGYYISQRENKKVLFIDVDPQANLTQSVFKKFNYKQKGEIENEDDGVSKTEVNVSVHSVFSFTSVVSGLELEESMLRLTDRLSIIPGDLNTLFFDRASGGSDKEHSLLNFIEDFKLKDEFDYIFLDCPPTYSFYTTAALLASDFYISPIKPDSYSILGLDLLEQVVKKMTRVYRDRFRNNPLQNLGVIFSNMKNTPTVGESKLIHNIRTSEKLAEYEFYFFNDHFLSNSQIPKQADYFISDSNSEKSINNLYTIIQEFYERIDFYERLKICAE
ncbi:ParA family protein [Bacillus subtilis]|uniref:ParA family protein n=1 Tax=Bacillus subtilis TaxID=1423 RepID=UPI000C77A75E|nr:ParA family protein [Bacillus subtilis]PLV35362.1 Sporulation initiation inhibitor protein Soj [Bacillus subtilis subsp. subtilis]